MTSEVNSFGANYEKALNIRERNQFALEPDRTHLAAFLELYLYPGSPIPAMITEDGQESDWTGAASLLNWLYEETTRNGNGYIRISSLPFGISADTPEPENPHLLIPGIEAIPTPFGTKRFFSILVNRRKMQELIRGYWPMEGDRNFHESITVELFDALPELIKFSSEAILAQSERPYAVMPPGAKAYVESLKNQHPTIADVYCELVTWALDGRCEPEVQEAADSYLLTTNLIEGKVISHRQLAEITLEDITNSDDALRLLAMEMVTAGPGQRWVDAYTLDTGLPIEGDAQVIALGFHPETDIVARMAQDEVSSQEILVAVISAVKAQLAICEAYEKHGDCGVLPYDEYQALRKIRKRQPRLRSRRP